MGKGTKRLENIFTDNVDEINQGYTINSWHVSQSVDAFTGTGSYDIEVEGSVTITGSIYHENAQDAAGALSNVVVRNNSTGEYFITGSFGSMTSGTSGSSGSSGTSGSSGNSGNSGTSGTSGSSGNSGTSGSSGSSGTSGTSGNGTSGTSGSSGNSGTSGSSGSSGTSGNSGTSGSSGSSGTSGIAGTSGTSGTSGVTNPGGSNTQVQFNDNGSFGGDSGFTYNKTDDTVTITSVSSTTPALVIANTLGNPTDGDVLGEIESYTTQYSTNLGGIRWRANGNFSGGTYPTKLEFQTTNGFTPSTQFSIDRNGTASLASYDAAMLYTNGSGTISKYNPSSNYFPKGNGTILEDSIIYTDVFNDQVIIGDGEPDTNYQGSGRLKVSGSISSVSIYATHNIVAYSDASSKTNIETIPNALDKVDAIRGITYNKIEDPDGYRYMGVIAQELQDVIPEVVIEGTDGKLSVAYGNIVGVLIEAVKELKAEIEELKDSK
jgi:hypothetical protein